MRYGRTTTASNEELTLLIAHKARLDADPVMLAAIERAVVEIAYLVRMGDAEYMRSMMEFDAMQLLQRGADAEHECDSVAAKSKLMDALAQREREQALNRPFAKQERPEPPSGLSCHDSAD